MSFKKIKLKGGSLSKTSLVIDGSHKYVLKEISLNKNREYGFQRWYSQLKKLQRFELMFPGLFPKLLDFGYSNEYAYFKIEYIENSMNGYEFLSKETNNKKIKLFFENIFSQLKIIHDSKISYFPNSLELYFEEEVSQRLNDALKDKEFKVFAKNKEIIFQGQKCTSLIYNLDEYKILFNNNNVMKFESFTHGNVTLENILYVPNINKVYFIDPYEENIIDNPLTEYSQLLQSSNSLYEFYNSKDIEINGNRINCNFKTPYGIDYFNSLLKSELQQKLSKEEYKLMHLFEISQFVRMLPFKSKKDFDKKIFFYSLASHSVDNILKF
jgi:hypothetical protein